MKCTEFREHIFDLADSGPVPGPLQDHLRDCPACAQEVLALRQTMSLLDEWQAPADTGPYFMTRLRARVREEAAAPAAGWMNWFRKPVLALSMTLLMVLSVGLFQGSWRMQDNGGNHAEFSQPGTAVGDLQYLDKNHDLLADFELLDGLEAQNQ